MIQNDLGLALIYAPAEPSNDDLLVVIRELAAKSFQIEYFIKEAPDFVRENDKYSTYDSVPSMFDGLCGEMDQKPEGYCDVIFEDIIIPGINLPWYPDE